MGVQSSYGLLRQSSGHQQNLVRKDPWISQNSYKLFWKSYGYHHNQHENQPGTFKSSYGLYWQFSGHQQNWYEKSSWHNHSSYRLFWQSYGYHHKRYENQLGTCTVLKDHFGNLQVTNKIGICCGNLMVTITADMKIGLEHSKFLWIMLAIVRSTTKIVMKEHVCTDLAMVMQTSFDQ